MRKLLNQPIRAVWRWMRCLVRLIHDFFTGEDARLKCEGLTSAEILEIYKTNANCDAAR